MGEKTQLKVGLILFALISLFGLFIARSDIRLIDKDFYVDYYFAKLRFGKELFLEENYSFKVRKSKKFQMLYHTWWTPLSVRDNLNKAHLRFLKLLTDNPEWYVKDFKGQIFGELSEKSLKLVQSKADRNEVGIINPNYFRSGNYNFYVSYKMYPLLEKDKKGFYLPLVLTYGGAYYRKIEMEIEDPKKSIKEIYPILPGYQVEKTTNGFLIKGYSTEKTPLKVVFLFNRIYFRSYYELSNIGENLKETFLVRFLFKLLENTLFVWVAFYPLIVFLIYRYFGREKKFTVPKYLSYIPNPKRKPWEVNVIFNGDALVGDENAFYATLLDLQRRGFLKINESKVEILKNSGPFDDYERNVIHFIQTYGEKNGKGNYELDFKKFSKQVKDWIENKNTTQLKLFRDFYDKLFRYKNPREKEFLDLTGYYIFNAIRLLPLPLIPFLDYTKNFWPTYGLDIYPVAVYTGTLFVNGLLGFLVFPSQFWGRWKKDYYREKLQWDAFRNFLSDFAMVRKYAPQDIVIWKEWLIYATALGVANRVKAVLKRFNIDLPEVEEVEELKVSFSVSDSELNSVLSGSSGFSFGAGGGGFGGGRTGAR
jgi:uncharacterized membrane protein